MNTINIIVNGKEVELKESKTIQDFVKERKVTGTMFVIEKNLQIIQKENYSTELLQDGDSIELVGFFGGG